MAVDGVAEERWQEQTASYNGGIWTYQRAWLVKVTSKFDRENVVSGAAGLPAYGEAHPGPIAAAAYAQQIDYSRADSSTPLGWIVRATYTSERERNDDPELDEVLISLDSEIYQEPVFEDNAGNAVMNSAGDYFVDPVPTRDGAQLIFKIQANVAAVPSWVLAYNNAVNNGPVTIFGVAIPIRQAKVQRITVGSRQRRGISTFYPLAYEVHVRSKDWRLRPLDAGFRERDADSKLKQVKNEGDNEEPTSPVPLDGAGKYLANPTPATAVYGDFIIYPELNLAALPGIN